MRPELWTIPLIDFTIKGYGLMLMIGFFSGAYLATRRAERVRASPEIVLNCSIIALVGSMIGARLFYVLHYWQRDFAGSPNPLWAVIDISKGGMEFYGGVIGAIIPMLVYLHRKRQSIRLYFDIMTPSLMWGLALTRIGCFLNGCCFGGVAHGTLVEHWAVRFPYGSPAFHRQHKDQLLQVPDDLLRRTRSGRPALLSQEEIQKRSPALADLAAQHKSLPVHPAQLYASINAFLGCLFLSWFFRVRKRHGMVFAVFLLTYPLTRIIEEQIRVDNPLDTFGLTISTALSIAMFAAGALLAVWFSRLPPHSPYAKAWTPTFSVQPSPKRTLKRAKT